MTRDNSTDESALAELDALEQQLAHAKHARDMDTARAIVPRINELRTQCADIKRARRLANATPEQRLQAAIFGDYQ